MSQRVAHAGSSRLRIAALGGVDEIGKNMTIFEYEDDIVVVDCGSIFPKEDMLGIDLVIPDVSYLISKRNNVRGYLFTHGHEDHIGATPYILRQVPAPLYGTRLTLALVDLKLKEHRLQGIPMQVVQPRDEVRLGKHFTAKFIHVSHSIAGACAIALTCPAGTVVISGDRSGNLCRSGRAGRAGHAVRIHQRRTLRPYHVRKEDRSDV